MREPKIAACLLAGLLTATFASASVSGLRSSFGEVIVRNVKIGQTYSLNQLLHLPLRVVNTGSDDVDLRVELVHANPLNRGYEEIPSTDWVRVAQSTFTVAPNHEAVTDLIVTIPNDPALLGRRFQANIWSHTTNKRAMLVGIESRLLLHVDSTPPTEAELKKKFVDENLANLDFTVFPVAGQISDVPVGREIDLRKERKISIKLINPNDRPLNFRVRSIPTWESALPIPEGFEEALSAQWLRPEKDVIKVDANSISETSFRLLIPEGADNRGKHFFFTVSFEILEQKIPARVFYRLAVDTEKPAPAAPGVKK